MATTPTPRRPPTARADHHRVAALPPPPGRSTAPGLTEVAEPAAGTLTAPPPDQPADPPTGAEPLRPHEPAPWRTSTVAGIVVLGGIGLLLLVSMVTTADLRSVLLALTVAVLPAPLLAGSVLLVGRYEPLPRRMLAVTFLYGATAAVALAGLLNMVGTSVLSLAYDPLAAQTLTITALAPVVEELLKGAAVLAVLWRHRPELTGVVDGLLYSAMVGFGFAISENVVHYLVALATPEEAFTATVIARGLLSPFAHPLFTAMFGMGLAITAASARWRILPAAVGLVGAVVLHALWNASALSGPGFVLVYLGVYVPLFIAVLVVAVRATRREGRLLRQYLAEEVEAGRLTRDEVETLSSLRDRRRAERRAAQHGGDQAKQLQRSFHHAATRLAFTRHRRARPGARAPSAAVEEYWISEMPRRRQLAAQAVS